MGSWLLVVMMALAGGLPTTQTVGSFDSEALCAVAGAQVVKATEELTRAKVTYVCARTRG